MSRHSAPTPAASRLALVTLRLYPQRWRRRYEDELRAHIDDHGATVLDVTGLALGAVRERWRGPNGPDPGRHPTAAAMWRVGERLTVRACVFALLSYVGYQAGSMAGSWLGPLPDMPPWIFFAAMAAILVSAIRGVVTAFKTKPPVLPGPAFHSRHTAWLMLLLASSGLFFTGWEKAPVEATHLMIWGPLLLSSTWVDDALDLRGRHTRVREAQSRYFALRDQAKRAEVELACLESLPIDDLHPDLIAQRNAIGKLQVQMEKIVEFLRDPDRAQPAEDPKPI